LNASLNPGVTSVPEGMKRLYKQKRKNILKKRTAAAKSEWGEISRQEGES